MEIEESNKASVFKTFITVYLPLAVCVVLVALRIIANRETARKKNLEFQMTAAVSLKRRMIETEIAARITDAIYLADVTSLYCGNTDTPDDGLKDIFYYFAKGKRVYDQVRFINAQGHEIIRVNMEADGPAVIGEDQLQDKSDRPYFKKTMGTGRGKVFASRFDLNIENDRVEIPYKPMLRLASPVEMTDGRKPGMVVLNYLGTGLIDRINEKTGVANGKFYFTNEDGYWFVGPAREDEWGFMFEYKQDKNMKQTYPDAWKQIGPKKEEAVFTKNGMFVFTDVYPIDSCGLSKETCVGENEKYRWKIVGHLPPEALVPEWRFLSVELAVSVLAMLAVLTWIWAVARTRRIGAEKRLFELAITDGLTKILNRRRFMELAEAELHRKQRYGLTVSMLMIDLDHFKFVNDTYGHHAGDLILKALADLGKTRFRDADIFARLGGEEFAVLMPETDLDAAAAAAERFRREFAETKTPVDENRVTVTVSIGAAVADDNIHDVETLLKHADAALYSAKGKGRNRVERFLPMPE